MNMTVGVCPRCGGEKKQASTTFTVDLGFGVVVVRQVPTFECGRCGDTWFADDVASRLEEFVAQARIRKAPIEVTQWQEVA